MGSAEAEPPEHHTVRERIHELEEAAIEAEFETGRHEETIEEARRHVVWRFARISVGVVVTGFGILLLALPGPGLVVVAVGLGILAQDVPFARRILDSVQERIPRDDDGNLPAGAKVMLVGSIAFAVAASAASVWWSLLR